MTSLTVQSQTPNRITARQIAAGMIIRTVLEDRTLLAELPGYEGYAQRAYYRLLPGV